MVKRYRIVRIAILFAVAFSLLWIGGTSSDRVALADPNTIFLSDCDFGFHANVYFANETVCVSGTVDTVVGGGIFPSGDVYVTANRQWSQGDSLSGLDVTGILGISSPNPVVGIYGGGAFFDEIVWLPELSPGEYDIVLDEDRDGVYNADGSEFRDRVLGPGSSSIAFRVVPAPLGAYVPDIEDIKLDAAKEILRWQAIKLEFKVIGYIKTLLDAAGHLTNPSAEVGTALAVITLDAGANGVATDYNDAVLSVGGEIIGGVADLMSEKYLALVLDPADPNYGHLVALDISETESLFLARRASFGLSTEYPFAPVGSTPLESTTQEMIARLSEQAAIIDALISSNEKYLGAQQQDDLTWSVVHANGLSRYATLLAENVQATKAAAQAVRTEMLALPLGSHTVNVSAMRAFQSRVIASGLTDDEVNSFMELGWTDSEITGLASYIAALELPEEDFTVLSVIDSLVSAQDEILGSAQALAADAALVQSDLESDVAEIAEPSADAGGPYTGSVGSPIELNGSGSASNDTSITYAWDLDLDGQFDDATGATPSAIFTTPGIRYIGLQVTNDLALSDIDYTTVEATLANTAPVITAFTPTDVTQILEFGNPLGFSVTANDPDTDPLSYSWQVDGVEQGIGTTFAYTPGVGDVGGNLVRVVVSDDDPFSPDAIEQRFVSVVFPDADSDGFRSDVDCNDGVPDVNPGHAEVVGNGIDDDCDPATPDDGSDPVASFYFQPTPPVAGTSVQFTDTSTDANDDIVSWEWDFGDSGSSTTQSPSHTFTSGGNFTVELTVIDNLGGTDTASTFITVLSPPTAAFSFTPDSAHVNVATQFTNESVDPDGTIASFEWDFDNDSVADSTEENPQFTFTSTGTFPVTLMVTDDDGLTASVTENVVVAEPPVPSFTIAPTAPVPGQEVQFTDTSTDDGSIVSWAWDFEDDGSTDSTEQNPAHTYLSTGLKTVRLTVTDNEGANGSTTTDVSVAVGDPPVSSFTFSPTSPVAGEPVQFTDTSTDPDNAIVAWEWDFESDGTPDSGLQNPSHIFPTFGSRNVTLTVTDQSGNQGVLTLAGIPVRARPVASFDVSNATPAVGETVTFTSTATDADSPIAQFQWDFGDGTTGSGNTIDHAFASGGTFDVTLTVTDVHSLSDSATSPVSAVDVGAPTADFSFTPPSPSVDELVSFFDESTDDGSIVGWEWDFDEDGLPDSTAQNPTNAFETAGTFTVSLTVTDDDTNTDTVAIDVVVGFGDPPTADFSFNPSPPVAGETTFFTDLSTDPDNAIVSWNWDFGDGGTSTLKNPLHVYTSPGTVDVSLTVIDAAGNSDTLVFAGIPVLAHPVADFTFAPVAAPPISAGAPVQFTDQSGDVDNAIVSYDWDFGDGDSSTAPSPAHSFASGGTFDVTLTVTDATGLADSTTQQVVVLAGVSPTADFTYEPSDPAPNELVQFTDQSTDDGSIVSWEWDFEDDGTPDSTAQNPTHAFPTGGDFDVRLTVEDNLGNTDTVVQTISIPDKPTAKFSTSLERNTARALDGATIHSYSSASTSTPPSSAIDNNVNTSWSSPNGFVAGEYIEVELVGLSLHSVNSVFLEASTSNQAIQDFEFQVSTTGHEDANFTTILTGTVPNDNNGAEFVLLTPADARYVRLIALSNYGGASVRVDQFEVRDDTATNVAAFQGDGVGAQIVGFSRLNSGNTPENVIGDNANSVWITQFGFVADEFFIVDLADDIQVIDRVFVEGTVGTDSVNNFEILASTTGTRDSDFVPVFSGVATQTSDGSYYQFPPVAARYVKFHAIDNHGNGNQLRLDQFRVLTRYRDGGIVSLREGPASVATASSTVSGTTIPSNAIDDNGNSLWRATGKEDEWLKVQLGGGRLYFIDTVQFSSSLVADAPADFEILVSTTTDDEAAFTSVFSGTGTATTALQEFTFAPVLARYVQILIHNVIDNGSGTNCCTRLNNFNVLDVDGRQVSRLNGVGAFVPDVSSSANSNASPIQAIDFSTSGGWTTANGQTENQWFKMALLENEIPGASHVIDRVQIRGSSGTNGAHDFEIRVSNTVIADPVTSDDATKLNDPNFTTVLTGTLPQDNSFHWFTFPAVEARFVQVIVKNAHVGTSTNVFLNSVRVFAANRGGAVVPFTDMSTDPGGGIVSWAWDFGDGSASTEQYPLHEYEGPGTYAVTLTVVDSDGLSDTATMNYTVVPSPTAAFTRNAEHPNEGQFFSVFDESFDPWGGDELTRNFVLSNNFTTTSNSFNTSFQDNGDWTIELEIMDNQFMHDTELQVITVANLPPVFALNDDVTGVWGDSIRAWGSGVLNDASGDGGSLICEVDFGDGSALIELATCNSNLLFNTVHVYDDPGVYTITVTVTDKDGAWASDTRLATINHRQSQTTIWGLNALRPPDGGGPLNATARLVDFDDFGIGTGAQVRGNPLVGRTITFSLGGVTQDVLTDVNGEASATFNYAAGQTQVIVASFTGDTHYLASLDRPFVRGDIVAAIGDGMASRYDNDGNFVNVFDSTTRSNETAGMCFDSEDNFYLTSFQASRVTKFNRSTGEIEVAWGGTSFSSSPESCVLGRENLDADPELEDVIYTGEVDGNNFIRKFDSDGNLLATYDVETRDRGADWFDLMIDPGTGQLVFVYTTEGDDILRYDPIADVQLPDFVPDQTVPANRLLPRPDSIPENAIDDNVNTFWQTLATNVTNEFFTVDLIGDIQSVDSVFVEVSTSITGMQNFEIRVSDTGTDDADFQTVFTGVVPRDNVGATFDFAAVDARYVRLFAIDNYGNTNLLRVDQFRVLNSADENLASLTNGATIVDVSSVQSDPLLNRPCFALRVLPDGSVLTACRNEVAHVSADGKELLHSYPALNIGMPSADLFALNLDPDGTSFWTAHHGQGNISKVDIETGSVLQSFTAEIRGGSLAGLILYGEPTAGVNDAPTAESQSLTTDEDTPLPITLTGNDPEDSPLTFEIINGPGNGVLTGTAPDVTYSPDLDFVGLDSFTFRVNDGEFNSEPATIDIEVLLVNSPPVADTGGPYVTVEGALLPLDGSLSADPDADDTIVLYEWDLDDDGEFDDATGVTTGVSYLDFGLYTVSLRVTDNHGTSGTASTSILVNTEPPTVDAGPDQEVDAGEPVSLAPATFVDPSPGDTHTAEIDWGDGTIEPGVVTPGGGILGPGGTVDGSRTYTGGGIFIVEVCVTDSDGATGCDTLQVTVAEQNVAPTADAGGPYEVDEGVTVALDGTGSSDADDTVLQYAWDLDEDGVFGETGVDAANGDETGATPTFDASLLDGTDTITVTLRVTDDGGLSNEDTAQVTINNVAPAVSATGDTIDEGGTATVDVTLNDPAAADTHTATVDWGDGGAVELIGAVSSPFNPTHVYTDNGVFTVTVTVTDDDGGSNLDVADVTVNNVAPTADFANDGQVDEGSQASVGFSAQFDPSSDDTSAGFIYSYDFGNDGSFEVTGSTVPTEIVPLSLTADGPSTVDVLGRIEDKDGGFTDYVTKVAVNNVAPTADAGGPYNVDEGSIVVLSGSATDPADPLDPLDYQWDLDDDGVFGETGVDAENGDETSGTPTFDATQLDGPVDVTVTLQVTDDDGGVDTSTATVTVSNVAPLVNATGDTVTLGEQSTVSVTFTDPAAADTHTATVDWGDGSAVEIVGAVTSPFTATHIYASADAFSVFVTVTDDNNGEDTDTAIAIVNEPDNEAPIADAGGPYSVDEGSSVALDGSGSNDFDGTIVLYQWDLDGDGVFGETGVDATNGDETGATPTFDASQLDGPDSVEVSLRVTDDDGTAATTTATVTVDNVAPSAGATGDIVNEGDTATVAVTFTDPAAADTHTASVDWGDGGAVENLGPVTSPFNPTHVYTDNGVFTVTVTVTDDDGGSDEATADVTVNNVAPTAVLVNDGPVNEGSAALVRFSGQSDPSSDDTAAGFIYSFDFGNDGSFEVTGVEAQTNLLLLSLIDGPVTAEVLGRIEDKDGGFTDYLTTITIDNVAPSVAATGGSVTLGEQSSVSVTFTDPGTPDTHTATVDWGDGSAIEDLGPVTSPFIATHTYASADTFTLTVTVTDDDGGEGTDTSSAIVTPPELVTPVSDAGSPYSVNEGSSVALDGSGSSDPDGSIVLYEWDLDEDGVFGETGGDAANGDEIGVTPTFDATALDGPSVITVSLRVTDNDGLADTASTQVTVDNVAPTAEASEGTFDEGATASVGITFTDPAAADTFSVVVDWGDGSTPDVIDPASSPLSPTHVYTDDGVFTATVTVTDDDGDSDEVAAEITVNNLAPSAVLTNDGPVDEGSQASVSFSEQSDPSSSDAAAGFIYSFDFGNDGSFEITESAVPTELVPLSLTADGPATVDVLGRIEDKDGGFTDYVTTVTVNNVAPAVTATGDSVTLGDESTVSVTFADPGAPDTHTATIDWGDGSVVENLGVVTSPFSATHTYASADTFTVTVTVTDDDGGEGIDTASAVVNAPGNEAPTADAGGPYTVDEGSSVTLDGSGSSDSDGAIVLYQWDLDDDGVFGETGADAANGDETGVSPVFSVASLDGPQTFTVTLQVTDDDGLSDFASVNVPVENVAPAVEATGDAIDEGGTASVSVTFTDPALADTRTASVDWGDGSGLQDLGTVTSPFAPTHVYTDNGVFIVTVSVTDDDGGVGTTTATVTVGNVEPLADLANNGPVDEGSQGSVSFTGQSDPSSEDTAAGFIYSYDFGNDGSFEVTGSATPTALVPSSLTADGPVSVDVLGRIEDKDGGFTDYVTTVTVLNVAPAVSAVGDNVALGEEATVSASFTDPGAPDTHSAVIDWGDGSSDTVDPAVSPFDVTHTYAGSGLFTVTVTVTDDDGGEGVATTTVSVTEETGALADLWVTKTGPTNPVKPGDRFYYKITIGNDGPDDAENVVITDVLPGGATLVSTSSLDCDCEFQDGVVICEIERLSAGAEITVKVKVLTDVPGDIVNTVEISSDTPDPDPDNNTASASVTVKDPQKKSADLSTTKTGPSEPVSVNEEFSYLITVSNDGPSSAKNVVITDRLPAGLLLVSTSSDSCNCEHRHGVIKCELAYLLPGSQITVEVRVSASSAGDISNTIEINSDTRDPDLSDNESTWVTTIVDDDPSGEGSQTISAQVDSSSDDAYDNPAGWPGYSATAVSVYSGAPGGNGPVYGGFRWDGLNIPDGAVILDAYVELTQKNWGYEVESTLALESDASPNSFSKDDSPADRWSSRTNFSVQWNPDLGAPDTVHLTPDLAAGIQELINTFGSLDSIVLLESGEGVDRGRYREWSSFDRGPQHGAKLHITYLAENVAPVVSAGPDAVTSEGSAVNLAPATFEDTSPGVFTAQIDWGDGTVAPDAVSAEDRSVSGDHVYADDGVYTVTVSVTDSGGLTGSDAFTVTVNNAAPVVNAGANQSALTGETVSLAASFTDAGVIDTQTAMVNWGDDTVTPAAIEPATGGVTATHTYSAPGLFTVEVCVTDDDGGVGCDTSLISVEEPEGDVESVSAQVSSGNDDAYDSPGGWPNFSSTSSVVLAGAPGGNGPTYGGFRWSGLNIPAGAEIVSAYVELSQSAWGYEVSTTLAFENADSPVPFGPEETPFDRWSNRTGFELEWQADLQTPGTWIATPDLAAGIQELVDSHGGVDTLTLLESGEGVNGSMYHQWSAFDGAPERAAKLHITWRMPEPDTLEWSGAERVLFVGISADPSNLTLVNATFDLNGEGSINQVVIDTENEFVTDALSGGLGNVALTGCADAERAIDRPPGPEPACVYGNVLKYRRG